jgi:CBS domain-containing protein
VVDESGLVQGVLTRRDLLEKGLSGNSLLADVIKQPPRYVYDDCTARQAADHMINHEIGRLPVISRVSPHSIVGIVTRSDILSGYRQRLSEATSDQPTIRLPTISRSKTTGSA